MSDGNTCVFLLIAVVFVVFAGEVGRQNGASRQKHLAVEAGVAEYTIDHKTGETSFVYKTCK